jgi:hypothetical protein
VAVRTIRLILAEAKGTTGQRRCLRGSRPGTLAAMACDSSNPTIVRRPLVAIFGAGRNGSTMLGRLLDGSPELWCHPTEVNYLCAYDDLARTGTVSFETVQNSTDRELVALDRNLPADTLVAEYARDWQDIDQNYVPRLEEPPAPRFDPADVLLERERYDVGAFLPAFLEATRLAYDAAPERRLLAFKTIEVPYIDDYRRVFPDLRCLHIVRDPITNWASEKRTWMYRKTRPFYFARDYLRRFLEYRWLPHARAVVRLTNADPEHHLVVRYEELCAAPSETIARVCAWLGVEVPADPEQLTTLGGRRFARMPENPSEPGVSAPERVVSNMAETFDYRDVVTDRERALFARVTGPLAEELGYTTSDARRRGALRLWFAWLPVDKAERMHVSSRSRWLVELVRRRIYIAKKLIGTAAGPFGSHAR